MKKHSPSSSPRTLISRLKLPMQIATYAVLALVVMYLFPRYSNAFHYHFEVGKPWGYDLMTAEFDFPIYKTEAEVLLEQQEALRSITPCYKKTSTLPDDLIVISLADYEQLTGDGYRRIAILTDKNIATTCPVSDLLTPRSAYEEYGLQCEPNIHPDTLMNKHLYDNAIESVSLTSGMVQQGERIIDRGEIVTGQTYQVLSSLKRTYEEKNLTRQQSVYVQIGYGLLIILLVSLFPIYLIIFREKYARSLRDTLFFCLIICLPVIASFLLLRFISDDAIIYLVPFAWVPIVITVFYDSRTALFAHLIAVLLVSLAMPTPFFFLFLQIVVGMVVIGSQRKLTQRAHLAHTALITGVAYALVYTALVFATSGNYTHLQWRVYMFILINVVLIICVYGVIYLLERLFGLVSDVTLIELSNVNSDLMHRFAEEAPGTFQHTLQVSNLATEAAKKIDANALLVRTGALYHDIGKLLAPQNFTENQQGGENPLMAMSNQEAAQTVIAHVSNGLQLAAKNRLPQVLRSFIATHHGTSLVRYFYNTEVNKHPGEKVDESLFRYPGPKPSSKEMAILMMADAVEARSRSLNAYTEETIAQMVNQMIDAQIADGQFSETDLSFRDVEMIREVFTNKLIAIHHHRIAYPKIESTPTRLLSE